MLKKRWLLLPASCWLLFSIGCGASEDMRVANEAVKQFRTGLDQQKYDDIYSQSDSEFPRVTKQKDFQDLMSAIHRKLGKFQSASQTSYFVNWTTSGTQVRLNFESKYEGGDAQEEFLWHVNDNRALLLGYHINSNALITK